MSEANPPSEPFGFRFLIHCQSIVPNTTYKKGTNSKKGATPNSQTHNSCCCVWGVTPTRKGCALSKALSEPKAEESAPPSQVRQGPWRFQVLVPLRQLQIPGLPLCRSRPPKKEKQKTRSEIEIPSKPKRGNITYIISANGSGVEVSPKWEASPFGFP